MTAGCPATSRVRPAFNPTVGGVTEQVLDTATEIGGELRGLISERTREGLAKARASGRKLGRPKASLGVSRLDGKKEEIRHFLELGVSKDRVAKITGVSRPTLYSFMNTRGLRPSPSSDPRRSALSG